MGGAVIDIKYAPLYDLTIKQKFIWSNKESYEASFQHIYSYSKYLNQSN